MPRLSTSGPQSSTRLGGRSRLCQVSFRPLVISFADYNHYRWIYVLILTIDANYRLKLKEKGIKNDPALGDGWAHWVESGGYKAYVKKYGHQVEVGPFN